MKTSQLIAVAVAATIAAPLLASAGPAPMPQFKAEKCYGINAASKNDCAAGAHGCAGMSAMAKDPNSWVYVPAGTCEKIDGGSTMPKHS